MKRIIEITCIVLIVLLTSCQTQKSEVDASEQIPGIVLENMDTSVDPKDDFYNYVNGNWAKTNTIPEEESSWGGFGVLRKSTRQDVLDVINTSKEFGTYEAGSDQQKAVLLFQSELDTVSRDLAGVKPLMPLITAINDIKSINDMQKAYAKVLGVAQPFMSLASFPDLNNSSMNTAYITPGGLGLPDRDYYLDQDDKSKERRSQYLDHVSRMLQFIDYDESTARKAAETVLKLETQLAKPRLDKIQSRDVRNFNNPRSMDQLSKLSPAIEWQEFIKDMGVVKILDTVMVLQPEYMKTMNSLLSSTKLEDIKTMMIWSTLNSNASYLSTEIDKANWDFYSKTLRGTKTQRSPDERALGTVNNTVGEAIGKLYVEAKFPPEAKTKAEEMIANVITAFQNRISVLDWMTQETKDKAIEKLDKFTVKIAYPDEWEDYSDLMIQDGNTYAENMIAVADWSHKKNMSEVGEPVDKTEWGMAPQIVNAYFNPLNNEIVFPAAILQPPFYNYTADDAVNYGGIGAVIGHEISHAFDDSGARFDGDGNVNNWWTADDLTEFEKRANLLADQYSEIEVLDSVFVNGKFTLGENIGDLGGVLGAYDGLQLHFAKNGRPDDIDGFTAEQRFFMSWATVWRTLTREDALRTQIKTDPHSPGKVRAIQPLKNVDAFYEAFKIAEGDKMYLSPEERVRIW